MLHSQQVGHARAWIALAPIAARTPSAPVRVRRSPNGEKKPGQQNGRPHTRGLFRLGPTVLGCTDRNGPGPLAFQMAAAQTAEPLKIPTGQVWLGTVRIPRRVLADGKALPAGRYRVRLTGEFAAKDVVGQTEELERWVEFVQGNDVKGRAMAPVVPSSSLKEVAESAPPRPGRVKVQSLKPEDQYVRLWFNHGGDQILVYLPYAS